MIALHNKQFGRGPTGARSHLVGAHALLCVMVDMGEHQRVRESRVFLQVRTTDQFIATVETITGRTVRAFASATDPGHGVVMENFIFAPDGRRDGSTPH